MRVIQIGAQRRQRFPGRPGTQRVQFYDDGMPHLVGSIGEDTHTKPQLA